MFARERAEISRQRGTRTLSVESGSEEATDDAAADIALGDSSGPPGAIAALKFEDEDAVPFGDDTAVE